MPRTRAQLRSVGSENEVSRGANAVANAKRVALENSPSTAAAHPRKVAKTERSFGDITNAISSFAIDSGKKGKKTGLSLQGRTKQLASVSEAVELDKLSTTAALPTRSKSVSDPALAPEPAPRPTKKELTTVDPGSSSNSSSSSLDEDASSACSSVFTAPINPDPCPHYNYDAENEGDITACPTFAWDIFIYYRVREPRFRVADYLPRQSDITKSMRMILVDWLVEIQENFELNHETLYLAVKLTDLYLDRTSKVISKDMLQLVGATALFITCKFDEKAPPVLDDFLFVCDDAYTKAQLLDMEMDILETAGFDLAMPLSYRFLRRYAKAGKVIMETLTLARYVLESSLMHYDYIKESESRMAAATLLLALRIQAPTASNHWTPELEKYSGYKVADVEELMWKLNKMISTPTPRSIKTIKEKYSHEVFGCVAKKTPLAQPPVLNIL